MIITCTIEGCDKKLLAKGLCSSHYQKMYKYGDPLAVKYSGSQRNHPLNSTWRGMKLRCNNPNFKQYYDYGGRGIKICDRWLEPNGMGFKNFLSDMGKKPSPEHTLDRINVNGNYEPSNCRWADRFEQKRNQKNSFNTDVGFAVSYNLEENVWRFTKRVDNKSVEYLKFNTLEETTTYAVKWANAKLKHKRY